MQLSNTEETQPGLRMHNPLSLCDKCWMTKDLLDHSFCKYPGGLALARQSTFPVGLLPRFQKKPGSE
jgi:hypothetical protein